MELLLCIGIFSIALAVSALIIAIANETDDDFLDLDDDFLDLDDDFNYFEDE